MRTTRVLLGVPVRRQVRWEGDPGILLSLLRQGGNLSTEGSVDPGTHALREHVTQCVAQRKHPVNDFQNVDGERVG